MIDELKAIVDDRKWSKSMSDKIDCYKCKWSHRLYDHTGKWTGAVFCSMRNGKLHKRFRGECELRERFEEQEHE